MALQWIAGGVSRLISGLAQINHNLIRIILGVTLIAAFAVGCVMGDGATPADDIGTLIANLSGSGEAVEESGNQLIGLGSEAVEPLIAALGEAGSPEAERIVYILGEIGDPRAVDPLYAAFLEGKAVGEVLDALEKIGDPRAVEVAVIALTEYGTRYETAVGRIITSIGAQSADPWAVLLQSEHSDIRMHAVGEMYFGEVATTFEGDLSVLVETLLRHQLLIGGSLDNQMELDLSRAVLRAIGSASVEPLTALLEGDDEVLWFSAAQALGEIPEPASLNALLGAISSSDQNKVLAGLSGLNEYLWNSGPVELDLGIGFENLTALLEDSSIHASFHTLAMQVIAESGDSRAVDLLVGLLENGNAHVSDEAIIYALGDLGDPTALTVIIEKYENADQDVKLAVVTALGQIGGSGVLDLLVEALQDDDRDVRMQALESLNNLDDEALSPLVAALVNQDIEKIAQAYMFFITRGPVGQEYLLNRALMEYGSRQMAIHYLNCGHPPLEQAARQWAEDHGYLVLDLTLPDVGNNPVGWGAGN